MHVSDVALLYCPGQRCRDAHQVVRVDDVWIETVYQSADDVTRVWIYCIDLVPNRLAGEAKRVPIASL